MSETIQQPYIQEDSSTAPTETKQQYINGVAVPKGVTIPPPEIRNRIEKTADYVSRRGRDFENRIRENEQQNPKFSFIYDNDPYFPFYEWRVEQLEANGPSLNNSIQNGQSATTAQPTGPPKPEPFEFSYNLPPISAQDFDIIKLTALFVARNGQHFLSSLSHAESRNYQYDFLKPAHSFYPLFTHLVEQYKKVIHPSPKIMEKIKKGIKDPYSIINKARIRAEWNAHQESETKKASEEAEKEREAYAQIDWHDFVVVETIKFTNADEKANLPVPKSKAELEFASIEQKKMSRLKIEEAAPDFDQDEEEERMRKRHLQSLQEQQQQQQQVSSLPQRPSEPPSSSVSPPANEPDMILPPPPGKIKAAGTSRRNKQKSSLQQNTPLMSQSPITGEMVPSSEYSEHMRISLLDPKWKEQKTIAESRQSTTNLDQTDVVANIKRLASSFHQEGDNDDVGSSTINDEHGYPNKRSKTEVQWDGYKSSRKLVIQQAKSQRKTKAELIEEQKREEERLNKIGPGPKPSQ